MDKDSLENELIALNIFENYKTLIKKDFFKDPVFKQPYDATYKKLTEALEQTLEAEKIRTALKDENEEAKHKFCTDTKIKIYMKVIVDLKHRLLLCLCEESAIFLFLWAVLRLV